MSKKKATGRADKRSFLDRDVIMENRSILKYNRDAERRSSEAARLGREKDRQDRVRQTLLLGVDFPSVLLEEAGRALVDLVASKERFGDAAKAAWQIIKEGKTPEELALVRLEWNQVLIKLAERAELIRPGSVPKGILNSDVDSDALLREAFKVEGALKVRRALEKFVDLLGDGTPLRAAYSKAWRIAYAKESAQTKRELGPIWAEAARRISRQWSAEHNVEDLPTLDEEKAVRQERRVSERAKALRAAGETVESWPIFAFEGEMLVDLLSKGQPVKEALKATGEVLGERATKVSPAEWLVVKSEWAKITDAITNKQRELRGH